MVDASERVIPREDIRRSILGGSSILFLAGYLFVVEWAGVMCCCYYNNYYRF